VIDATGKSLIPGLVMLHEHTYYPTPGSPPGLTVYGQFGLSFTRLYLAGGVTTMRTGGNVNGVMDITLASGLRIRNRGAVDRRHAHRISTARTPSCRCIRLKDGDDARKQVAYWADMGATSFKGYMQITRAELGAAIEEAHKRGLKVTAHLCSVTYAEGGRARHRQPGTWLLRRRRIRGRQETRHVPGTGRRAADHRAARSCCPRISAAGEDPRGRRLH
jgi:enamidase